MKTYVILENIRSAHNVGSVFRTADGAGVEKIYLTGYTPTPRDRFGRTQPEIQKTSLGAAENVLWESREDIVPLIRELQNNGVLVVAIEQAPQSQLYDTFHPTTDVAYIFGNEVAGISKEVLAASDMVLEIPMRGEKESLNVSVTAGIILFSIQ